MEIRFLQPLSVKLGDPRTTPPPTGDFANRECCILGFTPLKTNTETTLAPKKAQIIVCIVIFVVFVSALGKC